jgi:hypothetical protein
VPFPCVAKPGLAEVALLGGGAIVGNDPLSDKFEDVVPVVQGLAPYWLVDDALYTGFGALNIPFIGPVDEGFCEAEYGEDGWRGGKNVPAEEGGGGVCAGCMGVMIPIPIGVVGIELLLKE